MCATRDGLAIPEIPICARPDEMIMSDIDGTRGMNPRCPRHGMRLIFPVSACVVLSAEHLGAEHDRQRKAFRVLGVRLGRVDHDPQVVAGHD